MSSKFFNRELSWLEFNQRVLDQAIDTTNPLLERLKFIAITGSNLDEFFMVRVGGLRILQDHESQQLSLDSLTADQQLEMIASRVQQMKAQQYEVLGNLEVELRENGVQRLSLDELSSSQWQYLADRFTNEFQNVFSPIAIHADQDFPLLQKSKLALLVRIQDDQAKTLEPIDEESDTKGADRFAVLPFGANISRFITIPSSDRFQYVLLEDVIRNYVEHFFPGQKVLETCVFRTLRNADIQLDEDATGDLLFGMKQILQARKTSESVLLEISGNPSKAMTEFLQAQLQIDQSGMYEVDGPLDLAAYWELVGIQGMDELRDPKWPSQNVPELGADVDIFDAIRNRDFLLFHPYQTFGPVVRLLERAAVDPNVIAIKQTLYRTSQKSRVVAALLEAAKNGKNVTVILELKARFDEERNIRWARKLESAGVDVIYGVKGLKTHAKCCIVVRKEPTGVQRYVHIGTGNYNESTARIYSDISLLTCDEQIGNDAISFFNAVTGYSIPQNLQHLVAAPLDLRPTLIALIEYEIRNAKNKQRASITAKLNSLVDIEIIEAFYRASAAGVKIRLNVRGICCLRPGVDGLSENISVCSIVDRYLEHARIFHFHSSGDDKVFISSADWMGRNLNRRVELMAPVNDPDCKAAALQILEVYFDDNVKNRILQPDGSFVAPDSGQAPLRSQQKIHQIVKSWADEAEHTQATVFIPHRGESESA